MSEVTRTEIRHAGAQQQVANSGHDARPLHNLPTLDSVRALASLAVVATHVGFWTGTYSFGFMGTAVARLDLGVALFFVLSGFLLSRPFLPSATGPGPAVLNYYWKRALRVLPAYWIVAVVAGLLLTENEGMTPYEWVGTLTATNLYTDDRLPAGITQMWSLTTEIAFYIMLPLIMVLWRALTRGTRVNWGIYVLVALAASCTVAWFNFAGDLLDGRGTLHLQWLPASLVWFVLGIALAQVHRATLARAGTPGDSGAIPIAWIVRLGHQPGVCWLLAAAAFVVAATPLAGPPMFAAPTAGESVTRVFLYAAISLLVVTSAVFAPQTSLYRAVLSNRVLRHLGDISFGVFCVHVLVLHFLGVYTPWEPFTRGNFWLILLATTATSVVLAELLYRLVERPLMRLRKLGAPATT